MKFFIAILLTVLLSFAIGLYSQLPWFCFVFCAFLVGVLIHQTPVKAFTAGFLALLLLWGALSTMQDIANNHILSIKVAQILPLGGSSVALIVLTAIIGGLLAGMAALTGSYLRKLMKP